MSRPATILFVPGLRDHVEDHWQTIAARQIPGAVTVPSLTANRLSLKARTDALDATLERIDGDVIIVAHSAGVLITVHWAQRTARTVRGALLVTPADVETPLPPGYPAYDELHANGWIPSPHAQLPFPSLLGASRNDPLCDFSRAARLASDWGSTLVDLGRVGHLNPAAGFGPWPECMELIERVRRASPWEAAGAGRSA